eukprot:3052476-Rhodomonas_salina.1
MMVARIRVAASAFEPRSVSSQAQPDLEPSRAHPCSSVPTRYLPPDAVGRSVEGLKARDLGLVDDIHELLRDA